MSSSTSERPASRAGALQVSANKSRRVLSVLCSLSSEEVSVTASQHGWTESDLRTETSAGVPVRTVLTLHITGTA